MKPDRDLMKLHPVLRDEWLRLNALCRQIGIELFLTEGWRSPARQKELYAQGRTTPGAIVTNATPEQSYHCDMLDGEPCARAFDVAFRDKIDPYDGPWNVVGAIGTSLCAMKWGGHWKKPDRPHFYIERDV